MLIVGINAEQGVKMFEKSISAQGQVLTLGETVFLIDLVRDKTEHFYNLKVGVYNLSGDSLNEFLIDSIDGFNRASASLDGKILIDQYYRINGEGNKQAICYSKDGLQLWKLNYTEKQSGYGGIIISPSGKYAASTQGKALVISGNDGKELDKLTKELNSILSTDKNLFFFDNNDHILCFGNNELVEYNCEFERLEYKASFAENTLAENMHIFFDVFPNWYFQNPDRTAIAIPIVKSNTAINSITPTFGVIFYNSTTKKFATRLFGPAYQFDVVLLKSYALINANLADRKSDLISTQKSVLLSFNYQDNTIEPIISKTIQFETFLQNASETGDTVRCYIGKKAIKLNIKKREIIQNNSIDNASPLFGKKIIVNMK